MKRRSKLGPSQIRRFANKEFKELKKTPLKQSFADIPHLILTNPDIYIEIAEYVIKFRMVMWRNTEHTPKQIREAFLDDHLERISHIGSTLTLRNSEIADLQELVKQLISRLIVNQELNTHWATDYLVSLYRKATKWSFKEQLSFYTHNKPFQQIVVLGNIVLRAAKRRYAKAHILTNSQFYRRTMDTQIQSMQSYSERQDAFFLYMPVNCVLKDKTHQVVQPVMMWIFITSVLFSIGKTGNIDGLNFDSYLLIYSGLLAICAYLLDFTLSYYGSVQGIITRSPFSFNRMDPKLKTGMLIEISDALDGILKRGPQRNVIDESISEDTEAPAGLKEQHEEKATPSQQASIEIKSVSPSGMSSFSLDYGYRKKKKKPRKSEDDSLNRASTIHRLLAYLHFLYYCGKLYSSAT